MMRVVRELPPMFNVIDEAFHVRGKAVLFAWGDTIYNPAGIQISPELVAHEQVHGDRQRALGSVEGWWYRYISDPAFRLAEEMPAHVAEFRELCKLHGAKWTSQRNMRRHFAAHVGARLAAPLYGRLIGAYEAKRQILASA